LEKMAEASKGDVGGGGKQSRQESNQAEDPSAGCPSSLSEEPQAVQAEEQVAEEASCWHTGVCKWFNPSKGWGFINVTEIQVESGELSEEDKVKVCETESATVEKIEEKIEDENQFEATATLDKDDKDPFEEDGFKPSGDIFVHQSTIQKEGFRCLEPGELVSFQAARSSKGWECLVVRTLGGQNSLEQAR